MEAKETVMPDGLIENIADTAWEDAKVPEEHRELSHLYRELNSRRAVAQAQAEITWDKAIREVVGELGLHTYLWHDENNNQHICIGMDTWQAKLKKMGVIKWEIEKYHQKEALGQKR